MASVPSVAVTFHCNHKALALEKVLLEALVPFVTVIPLLAVMPVMAAMLVLAVMTPLRWSAVMAVKNLPPAMTLVALMALVTLPSSADKGKFGATAPVSLHRVAMEALDAFLVAEVLAVSSPRKRNIYPPATLALERAVPLVTSS